MVMRRCLGIGMMGCRVSYVNDSLVGYVSSLVDRFAFSFVSISNESCR